MVTGAVPSMADFIQASTIAVAPLWRRRDSEQGAGGHVLQHARGCHAPGNSGLAIRPGEDVLVADGAGPPPCSPCWTSPTCARPCRRRRAALC